MPITIDGNVYITQDEQRAQSLKRYSESNVFAVRTPEQIAKAELKSAQIDKEFAEQQARKAEIIEGLLEPVEGKFKPEHPYVRGGENFYDEMIESRDEAQERRAMDRRDYGYNKPAWQSQNDKRLKILYNEEARGTPFFDPKFDKEFDDGGIDVEEVEIEGIDYLFDDSTGIYYNEETSEEVLPKKIIQTHTYNKETKKVKFINRLETDEETEKRYELNKEKDLREVKRLLKKHATEIYYRIEAEIQEKKEEEKERLAEEAEAERLRQEEEEDRVRQEEEDTKKFRRKMVLQSKGTTEEKEREKEEKERKRIQDEKHAKEYRELQELDARLTARNAAIELEKAKLRARRQELEDDLTTDEEDEDEDEAGPGPVNPPIVPLSTETIDDMFGGQEERWNIFTRAKQWQPYPEARARKGEKGRAEYKKEGRVGFFDDFPEVPYWQGRLGLELYMDKVDFFVGKKKKRKKVARDRITNRIYMYKPETQMYEEQVQTDGYPTAVKEPLNKQLFETKICLAKQQGLTNIMEEYDVENLKGFYVEEDHMDMFDCNCNHLGKFDDFASVKIGEANRYDWSKSDMDKAMFVSREQINLIQLFANKLDTPYEEAENLEEYEMEFSEGLKKEGLYGNEISFLTAMSIHPNFEDLSSSGIGDMGTMIKFVDIRTEEEKEQEFYSIEVETVAPPPPPAKPVEKEKKPKKEKKPRTQAQLLALAKARENMLKKKAEFKKKESEK